MTGKLLNEKYDGVVLYLITYVAYILIGVMFLWIYLWNSITVTGLIDSVCETKYATFISITDGVWVLLT